jgi:outer membrane protein OmpA-like peptidoglycan-associated protein
VTTPRAGRARARQLALPVTVAAVGLATLGVVQALPNRQAVQSQLTDRSTRALSAAGITDARVQFDGRDATVHVQSAGDRDRALAVVRSQQGVRVAHVIVDRGAPSAGRTPSGRPSKRPVSTPPDTPPGRPAPSNPAPSNPAASQPEPSNPAPSTPEPSNPGPSNPVPSSPAPNGGGAGTTGSAPPPGASGDALADVQHAVDACGPVRFASASAALTPVGRKAIERVAAILRADTSVNVEIQGFTDAVGPASTNLALSRDRARTVYDTLRILGITAARMSPVGYGESHPRVPNDSRAHRAANRRVALVVRANPPR